MQVLLCTVFLAFLNLKDIINFMLIYGRFWELKIKFVLLVCMFSVVFSNYRLIKNRIVFRIEIRSSRKSLPVLPSEVALW